PVFPGAFGQAVIARQRMRLRADVGGALDVVVAAEDVGAAAGNADVAQRQLQDAVGARIVVANVVLSRAHAPDQGAGAVFGQRLGRLVQLLLGHAGDALDLARRPVGDFLADLVHAVDALLDVLLVFPTVLQHVPEYAPGQGHVGAGTKADVLIGMRRGARAARVADDHLGAVFLAAQDVLHGDRMRFGRIRADEDHRLGVVDVVVGVGHRAIAPGVGHTGDRGRVTNARLVVDVVGAPEGDPLALQVAAFVAGLGRAAVEQRVGPGFFANLEQLVAD